MKRTSSVCPLKQVSSVDVEAIGVALLRLLSVNQTLLNSVLDKASGNRDEEVGVLKQQRDQVVRNVVDERRKLENLMVALESPAADDIRESIFGRIRDVNSLIQGMDHRIHEMDIAMEALKQPSSNLGDLRDSYQYFWTLWLRMSPEDRRRAIRVLVKEVRLTKQKDDRVLIQFELISNVKIKTSTGLGGGSDDQVRNIVANGSAYGIRTHVTGVRGKQQRSCEHEV